MRPKPDLPLLQTQTSGVPTYPTQHEDTNDLSFTVKYLTDLRTFQIEYISDANLGNRVIEMTISLPDGQPIYHDAPLINQADALTRRYTWAVGAQSGAAFVGTGVIRGLPPLFLIPGIVIRVWDSAGISATDTITLNAHGWMLSDVAVMVGLTRWGIYDNLLGIVRNLGYGR